MKRTAAKLPGQHALRSVCDRIVVINLPSRQDRRTAIGGELARLGVTLGEG
ncbi:hypothetical protein GGQ59_002957, partial [Parvularcula dongshanensis]|nr:hypothetical protein [Parvularcula dongshanensis]